jgi:peroxiredoxin
MRKVINTLVVIVFFNLTLLAQNKIASDPIFVVNEKIVSKQKIEEYLSKGYIKEMQNSITDQQYLNLKSKLGENLGEKEFIVIIKIFTESEMNEQKTHVNTIAEKSTPTKIKDEYLLKVNDIAVDFNLTMLNGDIINLANLKGKVVLLNFWATWCGPCIREFYEIPSKILTKFKNEDFIFLPVSIGEDVQIVKNKMIYLGKKGIAFNVGIDPDKRIWNSYATGSIPKNFIIDKNGIINFITTGYNEENIDTLVKQLEFLLKN